MDDFPLEGFLDREVSDVAADAFGHRHFADALRQVLEDPAHEPPFSVGLLGDWGAGKSSIKEMYRRGLKDATAPRGQAARALRIRTITFNAWRYGGENMKRALLRHAYVELGGDAESIDDHLFRSITKVDAVRRPWKEVLRDYGAHVVFNSAQVFLLYLAILAPILFLAWVFGMAGTTLGLVAGAVGLPAGAFLFRYVTDPRRTMIPFHRNVTRLETPHATAEQYEGHLLRQLRTFKEGRAGEALGGKGQQAERLIVFVDDLDRLSPDEMVAGLEAVRTFMEIPSRRLPDGLGIVFVISCDENKVADALSRRRRSPDLPGTVFSQSDARRFLDRIFQFRLEIPTPSKQDMRAFALAKLDESFPRLLRDLRERDTPVETLLERLIHVDVGNPRNAIQNLNAFAQSWWVACRREFEGPGTSRSGGLHSGAVTDHPIALAALCALRVDFPDFYRDLEGQPDLIEAFSAVFLHGEPLDDESESVRVTLSKYTTDGELKFGHRRLRRYIASLDGLRWPVSLRPLLSLAEDPVTRKYGDRAARIFDAMVSGDSDGVLEALGRHLDDRPLEPEDLRLLRGMVQEDLQDELDVRQDHAFAVVARLAPRLPDGEAHSVLQPLVRRLCKSRDLRSRVGLEPVAPILPHVSATDRKELAGALIQDLLRIDAPVAYSLPSGQDPSLEEAVALAELAAELCLGVWSTDGLREGDEESLFDWMAARRVAVGGEETELPFEVVERWMRNHEEKLLASWGERYLWLLSTELADHPEDVEPEAAVRRVLDVRDRMQAEGEESRARLWPLMARLVRGQPASVVLATIEHALAHPQQPDPEPFDAYLRQLVLRTRRGVGEDRWAIDQQRVGRDLLELAETRGEELEDQTIEALVGLFLDWSGSAETEALAASGADWCAHFAEEGVRTLAGKWSESVLEYLPYSCVQWLGAHFADQLTSAEQSVIVRKINEQIAPNVAFTADASGRYRQLLEAMPADAFELEIVSSNLPGVYAQLKARAGDLDFLTAVMPAVQVLLARDVDFDRLMPAIQAMLTASIQWPANFAFLHEGLAKRWPEPDDAHEYEPRASFNEAANWVSQHAGHAESGRILLAILEMYRTGVVEEDVEEALSARAREIWPTHRSEAAEVLIALPSKLDLQKIAALAQHVAAEDGEGRILLGRLFGHFGDDASVDDAVATAEALLAQPAVSGDAGADQHLSLWMDAIEPGGSILRDTLTQLVGTEDLNDGQRMRVWAQVLPRGSALGPGFLAVAVPTLLQRSDSDPETARAVIEARQAVSGVFASGNDRLLLPRALVEALPSIPSEEIRNGTAQWIHEIHGAPVFDEKTVRTLGESEIELLLEYFPESRSLKRLLKAARAGS